jgi:NADH-quinone oxidoreductase subunit M
MTEFPWLSLLIWAPILIGLVCVIRSNKIAYFSPCVEKVAFIVAGLNGLIILALSMALNLSYWSFQWGESWRWLPAWGFDYRLGVDSLSLALMGLTALVTMCVIVSVRHSVKRYQVYYYGLCLILLGLLNGVFAATNSLLLYLFFEVSLIPMFLLIGIWGGENRIYATFKFFLMTFLGSMLFLLVIVFLSLKAGTLNIESFWAKQATFQLSSIEKTGIFWALLIAFGIKLPMLPLHTWLPDAHVEAPTGGSMLLAAILLKLGGYAMIRLLLPVVPEAVSWYRPWVIGLSIMAIIYISSIALVQKDLKKLIAYSSVAHMGFVTLGLFLPVMTGSGRGLGLLGAMVQMISHGLISAALFFSVGVLYDRTKQKSIQAYSGLATSMPKFASVFVLLSLANIGFPGLSGFVGEFIVLLATFQADPIWAMIAALVLVLGAVYMLWLVKNIIFGVAPQIGPSAVLVDITFRETVILGVLVSGIVLIGLWPHGLLTFLKPTSDYFVELLVF